MANVHKIRVTTVANRDIVLHCDSCDVTFFNNGTGEASFNRLKDSARRHRNKPVLVNTPVVEEPNKVVGEITTTYMDEHGAIVRGVVTDPVMLDYLWEPGHRGRPGYSDSMLN